VEAAVDRGLTAAGFLSYEAAGAFDRHLVTHPPSDFPLLWFGLYEPSNQGTHADEADESFHVSPWRPLVGKEDYLAAITRIRELIAAGDTYQVNYTFPMEASFEGNPLAWFGQLCRNQRTDHSVYVDAGRYKIISASPELFFRLDGESLETRPMKGTRKRGRWLEEDQALAQELASSEKDRAENVMIVDLLRNDMGQISETGSVEVTRLFDVERYQTVWQMTSTIESRTRASVSSILRALFPSGSVTGAPKVRTMQIIKELEPFPRGVYCGAIGIWQPGRKAGFNVAIRTVTVDTERGMAKYNVGGGITWGSTAQAEYEECLIKASVLTQNRPDFQLLESILFDKDYFLLDLHLARLKASAEYFGFHVDLDAVRAQLDLNAADYEGQKLKIRLLVARDGSFQIEVQPVAGTILRTVALAADPVDEQDVFLYHKTTCRDVYNCAKSARPDVDDVLLWNARGEVTESTVANVAVELDGRWVTPPVASGLLAGTLRQHLLDAGKLQEAIVLKEDLPRATALALFNSVRQWMPVTLTK